MTVWQGKTIKPQRLDIDAVRLEILNTLRKEGRLTERDYERTVATWEGARPQFTSLIGLTKTEASVLTGPTGDDEAVQKWVWTDEGTEPHVITPKGDYPLRFPGLFTPKTLPGVIDSRAGRTAGPDVYARKVEHPGTIPREWSSTIQRGRRKRFQKSIFAAMQRGLKKRKPL